MRILHFADAHIDMVTQGRHDPNTGLAVRTIDFLKALDTIVDTAIAEKVDLVIFAGDAYKDRTPVPTFQREWGRRIARLAQARVPVLLLVGNHDLSPAQGRAHALQEFETLAVPFVRVVSKPEFIKPEQLGLPVQIIAFPWVNRSSFLANSEQSAGNIQEVYTQIEDRLIKVVDAWLSDADPNIPVIFAAHASVEGAVYGGERTVMLGSDLVLSGALVRDPRLSYVALGHIHKAQDVNQGSQPPVIYPGSIERVDFGEARDDKFFVIATVESGAATQVEWRKLEGRRFIDRYFAPAQADGMMEAIFALLPDRDEMKDAVVRLVLEYPFDWEAMIDEPALRRHTEECLEFHFIRKPRRETRLRLSADQAISSLSSLDLLDVYWKSVNSDPQEAEELQKLAAGIIFSSELPEQPT